MMKLHHRFDGSLHNPVVVLSNSLGCSLEMWEPQMPALVERFRVLRYDHPGHGKSPRPSGAVSIAALSQPLLTLLEVHNLERVHLCGLSLGGMVGMWLAARAFDRVDRLVLCCTALRFTPKERWTQRATAVRSGGMDAIAEHVAGSVWFTDRFKSEHPETFAHFRAMLARSPADAYARCCDMLADLDLSAEAPNIKSDTLVVSGSEDPASTLDDGKELVERIRGSRHVILEPAAHLANVEQPHAFNTALRDHLEEGG